MKYKLKLKKLSVLYVEDDDIIRREFTEILKRLYGNVIVAANGSDALFLYDAFYENTSGIDLIISDVDMPIMNGVELLENIRKVNKDIPFIFTTAHSDSEFLLKSISLNVSEYMIKPININELISKVEILFKDFINNLERDHRYEELSKYIGVVNQVSIVSRTDTAGIIIDVNEFFCETSGYSKEELVGSNHNIVRHPNNSKQFFKNMWEHLERGESWKGKIKNRKKSGEDYFLRATIIPIFDQEEKNILEYISISFLTTEIDLKNRKFKKEVRNNIQDTNKIKINTNKKIGILENKIKEYKNVDFVIYALEKEKLKNSKLLSKIDSLEKDINFMKIKVSDTVENSNKKIQETMNLFKKEKNLNIQKDEQIETMAIEINNKKHEIIKLTEKINDRNKKIFNLQDILSHREDQLRKLT